MLHPCCHHLGQNKGRIYILDKQKIERLIKMDSNGRNDEIIQNTKGIRLR